MILRRFLILLGFILLAAVIQAGFGNDVSIIRAKPDLILVVTACGGVLTGPVRATLAGLWAGILTAALQPVNYGSILASRTVMGILAGWLHHHVIRDSIVVPPLVVLMGTISAEVIYFLMAPTHNVHAWVRAVGGETLYNMALSFPVYFGLRALGMGPEPVSPFERPARWQ
ncbi:MAG TPA: LytS/YhcK type 5TM receptor domain-containing protein [Capsulimonadaceae bacterium]|nr:LytS/YhcK type 5TM receptor domain-containing protein [Capsulimonadaceae bacterium]